ncbi:hypothetical protein TrVGV298_002605 [Trichoderma virens]|nr:hypothetical protein TrVGV298_002605 [Trichoderma virens]
MDKRTNPNSKDDDGRTPISHAAKNEMEWENEEEEELILTRDGANPNLEDKDGQTALYRAIEAGHDAIITLLAPVDTITIFILVQEGNREAIKSLVHAKYNIDEQNGEGHTPLHAAILSRQLEITKDLLSYGARIDLRDSGNMTPLRLAMREKDERFIRELLKHKANMNETMAKEWRATYGKEDEDIVLFSETENGEIYVDFVTVLPTANEISEQPSGVIRSL